MPSVTFALDTNAAKGTAAFAVDPVTRNVTITVGPGTTANEVITRALADPAFNAAYSLWLATNPDGTPNSGNGRTITGAIAAPPAHLAVSPATGDWTEFGLRLPNAKVTTIKYVSPFKLGVDGTGAAAGDLLVIGTLGRGAFTLTGAAAPLGRTPVVTIAADDGSGNHTVLVHRDPSNPDVMAVVTDGAITGLYQVSTVDQVVVRGLGGNDTLQIEAGLAFPRGVRFDGGTGRNRLVFVGNTARVTKTPGEIPGQGTATVTEGGRLTKVTYDIGTDVVDQVGARSSTTSVPGSAR